MSVDISPYASSESPPLEAAFEVLNYNQQLIQFADSKAGNLIVINSLFIAAAQASGGVSLPFWLKLLQLAMLTVSGSALLLCLWVIMGQARLPSLPRRDFIFFGDVAQCRNMNQYSRDFLATSSRSHLEDALRRTYILALIARQKFAIYSGAQLATVAAAGLWLTHCGLRVFL